MSITTYAGLQTAIADFLNRDNLASAIPTFIALAEAQFNRKIRSWRQEERASATLDTQYSALPANFLQPIRLQLLDTENGEIAPVSTARMIQLRGDTNDETGRPRYYAITAQGLELFPTPNENYSASLVYYGTIPALSNSNTSNWLLANYPDVYLYGSLVHTAPYLSDDARIAIWAGLLAQTMAEIEQESEFAKYGGSGLVIRNRR
jgi:hypothetical protein